MEAFILAEYAKHTTHRVFQWPQDMQVHCRDHPWLFCTPDAYAEPLPAPPIDSEVRRLVEAKTTGYRSKDWGEEGTGNVPIWYAAQAQVQMVCTRITICDIAVDFAGGDHVAVYTIHADPAVAAAMIAKLEPIMARIRDAAPKEAA